MAWCGHIYDYGMFLVSDVTVGKHASTKGVQPIHYYGDFVTILEISFF